MNKRTLACLLVLVWSLTTVGLVYGQETDTFALTGTVTQATGEVAPGFTVVAVNEKSDKRAAKESNWLGNQEDTTTDEGMYTLSFIGLGISIPGLVSNHTTQVGDEIVITVTDSEDNEVGKETYIVQLSDVQREGPGATVDITIGATISIALDPVALDADGSSTSTITITVADKGKPVTNDTVTVTPTKGTASKVTNNGDGTYTVTYTAAKLTDITQPAMDELIVMSATLDKSKTASVTLNVVPGPPAKLMLSSNIMTLSGGQSAQITAMLTDAIGNGVSGRMLDASPGIGMVSVAEVGSGRYTVTYKAPAVVSKAGIETVTVSVPGSDISETIKLNLTSVPPEEFIVLIVTGRVLKKNSNIGVPGVMVSVMVNQKPIDPESPGPVETQEDGIYEVTGVGLSSETGFAAKTGDLISIEVTDSTGRRGYKEFTLMAEHGEDKGSAIVDDPDDVNVETDIKSTTTMLVIEGTVFFENGIMKDGTPDQGVAPMGAGLTVTIKNPSRGVEASGTTDEDGLYRAVLSNQGQVVAETDDQLMIMVEDTSGNTYEKLMGLTGDMVEAEPVAEIDITTDFPAAPTLVLIVLGSVTNADGTPAGGALPVTVTVGSLEKTTTTTTDGTYTAYITTFIDDEELSPVAMPRDSVKVVVMNEATSEKGVESVILTSEHVINNLVPIDVQFPAETITIAPIELISLDESGSGSASIVATITNLTGGPAMGLAVTASLDGIGSLMSEMATDEGGGKYTLTYSVSKMFGDATVMIIADSPGTPMASVMVSVVDEMKPIVMATADLDLVGPGDVVTFDGSESTDNVKIASYSWDFGDGNSSDQATVKHTYAAPGTYTAMLTVTDTAGNSADSDADSEMFGVRFPAYEIMVMDPDNVKLDDKGEGMGAIKATVTGTVTKTATAGLAVTAKITDGMGTVSEAKDNGDGEYTFTYTAVPKTTGEATVMFMIDDKALGTPIASAMVSVVDETKPDAMAIADPLISGLNKPVTFDGSGSTDNVKIASYSWDFGDGNSSDMAKMEHSYTSSGKKTVMLTVTDTSGNEDSDMIEVTVGGLIVTGKIVEADLMDLMSPVTVVIKHVGSGEVAGEVELDGANYEAIFTQTQTAPMKAGDSLIIEARGVADPKMLFGSAPHTITADELTSGTAKVAMLVITDRTSTYTITGLVLGDGLQPIEGAIVTAESAGGLMVQDVTDDIGSYSLFFDNFAMNPALGDPPIDVMAEVPDGIPLRTSVVAFMQDGSRISRADLRSVRLGGLGLNTPHYHRFVHGVIQHIIGGTTVGKALDDASPEQQRRITNQIIRLINNSVPGGLFPPQLAIGPDFTMNRGYPLIFEDPEYMDLENFGNGIFPSPLESLGTALNARRGDLTPVLTGDKLDLYLSVPILHADKVMFQLKHESGMTTPMSAHRVTRPFSHTFQLEEEQAILFLPSWPGIESGMESVFSSVTLMYKSKDSAPIGTALGANLRLGAVLQKALSDMDMELTALLQNALPAAIQAQVIAFQGTLRTVKNELPSGPELDRIRNDLNELKKLQDNLEALRGGMLVPDLYKSLGIARELLVMVQTTLPPAAQRKIAELQGTITGLEGSLSNFLNPSVAPALETDYMEMPMMARQIGDQVIWETEVDGIQPGKAYHYYYKVMLANPVTITLPGQAPIMISQWAMPDPRNLQVEDRGIIERLITPEIQAMIGHILDPAISAIAADQPFAIAPPTLENIRPGFELALAILPEATKIIEEIGVSLDPMLDSVFTVPVLDGSQSLWIGKYDFGMLPDGEYTLSAAVYDVAGNLIPDTQLPGKAFVVDRTAPMADVMIGHDPNVVGMYQREDGSHVATVLPMGEGPATLKIRAMPAGPQNGLVGYLYQMMPMNGNIWGPLVVAPDQKVKAGLARNMLLDLLTGVPLIAGIQVPDVIRDSILDDLSPGFDLLDVIPITLSAPHKLDLLLRAPTPPELAALAGTTGLLPINIGREMTTLQLNNYRIRAVGIDNLINISSHTVPVMLDVVSPDADMAMISYIVVGDCNGDGDTDDVGESGPADGLSVYSNKHTNLELTVKIKDRTVHPLTSIVVAYSSDGTKWTHIETFDMMAIKDAMSDLLDPDPKKGLKATWNVDDYDELVVADVKNVMVRAVATNMLTLMDTEPMKATIIVDPDVCPVPPTVLGVQVTLQETNPDSDPDINNLDSEGNHADGPLVGGAMGNITVAAYTPYRTGPVTDKVRFEVRRRDDTAWMMVENNVGMESVVVKAEDMPASIASVVQGLVGMVADGTSTVPIPTTYRKWMVEIDTAALEDTITNADAAEGRDVRVDANPWIVRAVAIAGGADYTNDRVHASFSVDNVDDVAPLESTMIVMVSDNAGMLMASEVGVFTVGGIVDETVPAPVAILTAKPRAHVSTFDHIKLMVNMRNADGTLGAMVDVGKVVFESSGGYYTATLDVSDLANAEYGFQALAVDAAMNVEKKVDDVATDIDVENYTPPPDSVTISEADDITEAYRGGYLVTKSFTFTVVAVGIHPPEIDVMLGGSSARGAGLLTVEKTDDGGGGLADPRTFVVTLDTSTTPDGKYMPDGVVTKRNGSSIFELPEINIDNTGPVVEIGTPVPGHEMSSLPTIRATFTDGMGGGVESSSDTVMLELVRLMPAGESVDIPVSQDDVEKPDAYIVEDDPETVMVEADMGDIVYTSVDVLPGGAYQVTIKVTDVLGNTTNMGMGVMADFTIAGTLPGVSIQSPTSGQGLDYDMPEIIVVYSGVGTMIKSFTLSNEAGEMVAVNDPVMVSAPDQLDDNKMSYMPTEALDDGKYTAVVMVEDANGEVARDAVTFMVSADDTTKTGYHSGESARSNQVRFGNLERTGIRRAIRGC